MRGNVGQPPRINRVGENTVIRFSLATNETFRDRSGTLREETTWHTVVAWSGKGMPDFGLIRKGTCVYVTGRLRMNRYTAPDGGERQYMEVLAGKVSVCQDEQCPKNSTFAI